MQTLLDGIDKRKQLFISLKVELITLVPKLDENMLRKEKGKSISFMKIVAKS